jgi:class 3 adenylate cyclase/tetratricopeptide (TPR) repeat protein
MTFEEILDQAIAILQRRGRLTYRTLKLQFHLDDEHLEALKDELIYGQRLAVDEDDRVLVWTGDTGTAPPATAARAEPPARTPLVSTPPYLAEKIFTSRSALEGERKQVTVLFADIKGSTELIASLDPEAARHLLDPALHLMMAAVHRYEGTVNQVLGDGIMALFGAPVAHEDHAARACYAALAMQAAMQRYAEEVRRTQGLTVQIRVGLNAGEVVVRAIGNDLHMDYSAIGQTTHLAARMEQLAAPGSILLTAATLRLVEGLVRVNALGPVPVKGLAEPVEVFELVGVTAVRQRLQATAARGLSRFVGRDQALESLQQALQQAGAGHGQLVALVGEAGVGKSRLVYEFVHAHRPQGWLVLASASVSYGKATPYFPVLDLLRRYCHLEDGDDAHIIRAKVTGQVLTLDAALQEALPALLWLLDALPDDSPFLTLDPPQRRLRTLDALTRVLLRASQGQPLVLVFEDLHWIDTETQALLDSLVESLPTAQILLLVNYRPEYQHGWGSKTYYTQLRLDPLPQASVHALLQALLGDDPSLAPLTQLLTMRTQGNPFFLEESVRTLVETQVLVGERGAYCLAQALPSIQVPATVQAVLAARIDRLPPEEKQLVQTAAVVGTEVPLPLLQAIAEVPEAALYRGLARLQAAELLYETRLFPEREYTFKHALTHEVAYGSLLQDQRRTLHRRIVVALEQLAPDHLAEHVERLAHHALRGAVWDKAVASYRQAGARAMSRSAHQEAVTCLEHALVAWQHLPEDHTTIAQGVDLRFDLGQAITPLWGFARTLDHLREAERLVATLDDQRRLGDVSAWWAAYLYWVGDPERALMAGHRALTIATALGDVVSEGRAMGLLGIVYYIQGDHSQAIEYLQRAMATCEGDRLYERSGYNMQSVVCCNTLPQTLAERGAFATGREYGEEGRRITAAVEHLYGQCLLCSSVGHLHLRQGDLPQAIAILETGLGLCQRGNFLRIFCDMAARLGAAYALAGRVTEALPLLEQAVAQADVLQQLFSQAMRVAWLSEALLLAGRREEAQHQAARALELSRTHQERGNEAWVWRLLGELAAHGDPPEVRQAEASYQQALARAEELDLRPLQAHCYRGLGTLYLKTAQREQAHPALSAAIALYRDMDMTFWLPQTEAALAQVEGQ